MTTGSKDNLLRSPILPNKGAAGIKIGTGISTVQKRWGDPAQVEQIRSDHLYWSYEAVWFWFKGGKVDQIGLYKGYAGQTPKGIGIGSARKEVEAAYGPLEWDGCWLINQPPFGIAFDFDTDKFSWGKGQVTGVYVFRE